MARSRNTSAFLVTYLVRLPTTGLARKGFLFARKSPDVAAAAMIIVNADLRVLIRRMPSGLLPIADDMLTTG